MRTCCLYCNLFAGNSFRDDPDPELDLYPELDPDWHGKLDLVPIQDYQSE
jgi:hypothetical protein